MQTIINYIIESSAALGILTIFYMLFLHNSPHLVFKRIFLIGSLLFVAILPLVNFTLVADEHEAMPIAASAYTLLATVTVSAGEMTEATTPIIQANEWIPWMYIAGFALLMMRLMIGLVRIGLMQNLFSSTKTDGFRLFITAGSYHPFSFFRWVFIPKPLWENGTGKIILLHEQVHSKQWHSIDVLLLELVLIVQWFNPFAWVVRRELKDNHEFLADRAVLGTGISRNDYLRSMLFQMAGTRYEMANNFSLSITKKRVKMMKSNIRKSNVTFLSGLSMLLLTALLFVFACQKDDLIHEYANPETAFVLNGKLVLPQDVLAPTSENVDDDVVKVKIDGEELFLKPELSKVSLAKVYARDEAIKLYKSLELPESVARVVVVREAADNAQVFMVVEQMPKYPGGHSALMNYLSSTVKYPVEAQAKREQGKVYVSFIIGKQGTVYNVKVARSVSDALDQEAIRVVKAMPNWEPGMQHGKAVNVKYMLPINFVLQGETDADKAITMWIMDNKVRLLHPKKKELSTHDAVAYLLGHQNRNIKLSSYDNLNRLTKFSNQLKKAMDAQQVKLAINNNVNKVMFQKKVLNDEEETEAKEAIRSLVGGSFPIKLNVKDNNDGNKVISLISEANSSTITALKKLERYFITSGGHVHYWKHFSIVQKMSKEEKDKEAVVTH